MKLCPNCEAGNREGTLFCQNCGQGLYDDRCDETIHRRPGKLLGTSPTKAHTVRLKTLSIHIQDAVRPIVLDSESQVTLGRIGLNNAERPDLDLAPYGALEKGVSRRHAMIEIAHGSAFLRDLHSRNGTYLNGQQLPPYEPRALCDGDEIRLGTLAIHVYF